jgi:hypothetical protein
LDIIENVRKEVEVDGDGPFRFDMFLIPEEGKVASVLAEGGLTERVIEEPLQKLIDESRDFLERLGSNFLLLVLTFLLYFKVL